MSGQLTEAVLGADIDIPTLHSITVTIRAGLGVGGAGGEVPGDPYDMKHGRMSPHVEEPHPCQTSPQPPKWTPSL